MVLTRKRPHRVLLYRPYRAIHRIRWNVRHQRPRTSKDCDENHADCQPIQINPSRSDDEGPRAVAGAANQGRPGPRSCVMASYENGQARNNWHGFLTKTSLRLRSTAVLERRGAHGRCHLRHCARLQRAFEELPARRIFSKTIYGVERSPPSWSSRHIYDRGGIQWLRLVMPSNSPAQPGRRFVTDGIRRDFQS